MRIFLIWYTLLYILNQFFNKYNIFSSQINIDFNNMFKNAPTIHSKWQDFLTVGPSILKIYIKNVIGKKRFQELLLNKGKINEGWYFFFIFFNLIS